MKKMFSTCLLILQFFLMSNIYADTYQDSKEISKKINVCASTEDPLKYLLDNNKRIPNYSLTWNDIEIPEARPGLLGLLNMMFIRESEGKSVVGEMDFIGTFPGIEKCKHEICIAKKIFGEVEGVYFLYFLDKYNFNLSPYATKFNIVEDIYQDSNFFSVEELKTIANVFNMLPPALFKHYKFGSHFKKINKAKDVGKENVIADSALRFFSLYSRIDKEEQVTTVIHELGHNLADFLGVTSLDEAPTWLEFSEWKKIERELEDKTIEVSYEYKIKKNNFVSEYAKTTPVEDFAESFAAYVVNPKFLQKKSPEKYKYIKEYIFGGIEYDGKLCKTTGSKKISIENRESKDSKSICMSEFVLGIKEAGDKEFNKCLIKNYAATESMVLTLNEEDVSHILGDELIHSVQDDSVADFVTNIFDKPHYCEDIQTHYMAFDSDTIPNLDARIYMYGNTKSLCRWAKGQSQDEHDYRSNLANILRSRVFDR